MKNLQHLQITKMVQQNCYSFEALATRKDSNIYSVLIKHLTDTAIIPTFQGCLISSLSVGDYFLEVVTPQHVNLDAYKLTEIERKKIDSIIIFGKNVKLNAKSEVLKKIKPEPHYYNRIREILINEKDDNALIALSKFQQQQDKEFIIERLTSNNQNIQYYGLQAVKYFPDSAFFTYLSAIHSDEIKKSTGFNHSLIRVLYLAIVQYKNPQSRELLELTLNTTSKLAFQYHSEYIWLALELYPDTIYDGIQPSLSISPYRKRELQFWFENEDR